MSDRSSAHQNGSSHTNGVVQPEETPNDLFKKMVINNEKQNQRIFGKFFHGTNLSYDLERASSKKDEIKKATIMRHIVCILGLSSLAMSQMSRMILNQTITMMVDPKMINTKTVSVDGSCPWPEGTNPIIQPNLEICTTTEQEPMEKAKSLEELATPTTHTYEREISEILSTTTVNDKKNVEMTTISENLVSNYDNNNNNNNGTTLNAVTHDSTSSPSTSAKSDQVRRFEWDMDKQSVLKGGFFYSYFLFMIFGGRMAEAYGSKYVLLLAVGGSGIINLATPWMASYSYNLFVCSRIVMGSIQAGVFPGIYALINRWLTMSEASIYAPTIKLFLRLGMLFGSLVPGLIGTWPGVYYFTGIVSTIWAIVWILVASSSPQGNKWVSESELEHIMKKKRKQPVESQTEPPVEVEMISSADSGIITAANSKNNLNGSSQTTPSASTTTLKKIKKPTPWIKLLTAPSVIGLVIVKLTFNFGLDFLSIELPSYLKYVHHATDKQKSFITTFMFSIQVLLIVFVGWLAKSMVKNRPFGLSKTAIRKIFQSLASIGIGVFLFVMTFNDCSLIFVGIILQIISLLSMFAAGGETMLPYDLSDEYPATIMAIANSVANISGVTETFIAGKILNDQGGSYDRWNIVIRLIAGVNVLGGLSFAALVKAKPIDFESKKKKNTKGVDSELPSYGDLKSNGKLTNTTAINKGEAGEVVETTSETKMTVAAGATSDYDQSDSSEKSVAEEQLAGAKGEPAAEISEKDREDNSNEEAAIENKSP